MKALKERFLRGKTSPCLANIDIHVICGCIKDFLRNLREPLIPTALWAKFANAVQNVDDEQAVKDLYGVIYELPQANRDTLSFLILHLKRYVLSATCTECISFFGLLISVLHRVSIRKCRLKTWPKSLAQLSWDILALKLIRKLFIMKLSFKQT